MNNGSYVVNLTRPPEIIQLGERQGAKLGVADNTYGARSVPRFFDAIVSGEKEVARAMRLGQGDSVTVIGQLEKQFYIAKKDGKNGVRKGQKVFVDAMPFARVLAVHKSATFFEQQDGDVPPSDSQVPGDDDAPSLEYSTGPGEANPLGDI